VIGVRSHDDALRELRAAPAVDLVLTDIHLAAAPDDKSGIALARYVKSTYLDLPVAGYSAYFADEDLGNDRAIFDAIWAKGHFTYKTIDEMVAFCRARALEHRRARQDTATEVHALLRRRHETAHPAVELMRDLRPGAGSAAPVEEALARAGYRLKLIEADVNNLAQPVIVWMLDCDEMVEAEVYGQPALYAEGRTDEEAIRMMVDLMHLYGAEIGAGAPQAVGPALSLTKFLEFVLRDEKGG
jgi:CheY-like chemotaxis protein